jgi:hypothetical protein
MSNRNEHGLNFIRGGICGQGLSKDSFLRQEIDERKKTGVPHILPTVSRLQRGVSGRLNGCAVMMILNLARKFSHQLL